MLLQWIWDAPGGEVAAGLERPTEVPHKDTGKDPTDLLHTANLSLVLIFSKQDCVYAKLDNHTLALV